MLSMLRAACWPVLFLLSLVFGFFVWFRNLFFDLGLCKPQRLSVPVISVGNIAMGGVGKTPIVLDLVARLRKQGQQPAVALRGYKGDVPASGVVVYRGKLSDPGGSQIAAGEDLFLGDEAALYRQKLTETPLFVGSNRASIAKSFLDSQKEKMDLVVMDDGFQHRWLHRDHNVVVIPVNQTNFGLFPLGLNRETPAALKRASLLVWMHTSRSTFESRLANKIIVSRIPQGLLAVHCLRSISQVSSVVDKNALDKATEYTLVCALGNNQQVAASLVEAGYVSPAQKLFLRDHQKMTAEHAAQIESYGYPVVTTWKDYLRQPHFFKALRSITFVAELGIEWSKDPLAVLHGEDPS